MTVGGRLLFALAALAPGLALGADPPEAIPIHRVTTAIVIDGDLSDAGWHEAPGIETWFETNVSDSLPSKLHNVAYLAYDQQFFYAGFVFEDPEPARVRAPLGDRDDVPGFTDYGGVILDTRNDGKTAQMFLANARGIQYDAMSSDSTGEDSSPDFFWDSAARITDKGWQLELRIPFSSLRYASANPEQWGVLLYRNYPREFRYQMFTSRLPRDSTCFICNVRPLVGLTDLPAGAHWVVAPYVSGAHEALPEGLAGSRVRSQKPDAEAGVDAKWIPNPDTILDATLNPDFSQIETDAAQIRANERFALFYPEKRPFFLESVDMLSTPIQAVYTRTFTSPRYGARLTGDSEKTKYTVLLGEDRGGGSVIFPGSQGSDLVDQDFHSWFGVARVRRDLGRSFVGFLYTGREIDGGGHNHVAGPDVQWRPTAQDSIGAQLLWSFSELLDRTDEDRDSVWDGSKFHGYAARLSWYRQTTKWDYYAQGSSYSADFRADNGFVPQVDYRNTYAELGRTFRPKDKPVSRLRTFVFAEYTEDQQGELLYQQVTPGFGMDARWNSFIRLEFSFDNVVNTINVDETTLQTKEFHRFQVRPLIQVRPGKVLQQVTVSATIGDDVDFTANQPADGLTTNLSLALRPSDHVALSLSGSRRTLDAEGERLFTATVARLRAVYTFNSRSWLRLIGQWDEFDTGDVVDHDAALSTSAVFAYKLNWQTVLYVGYGDERTLDNVDHLRRSGRQAFFKFSYAFQG